MATTKYIGKLHERLPKSTLSQIASYTGCWNSLRTHERGDRERAISEHAGTTAGARGIAGRPGQGCKNHTAPRPATLPIQFELSAGKVNCALCERRAARNSLQKS